MHYKVSGDRLHVQPRAHLQSDLQRTRLAGERTVERLQYKNKQTNKKFMHCKALDGAIHAGREAETGFGRFL